MKFDTLTRRVAAAGAVSALAASALVAATATSASAAPVTNTYACTGALSFSITLDSDAPGIEAVSTAPAGLGVPAGFLSVNNTFTLDQATYATLQGVGVEDLTFPDFSGSIGTATIPVNGVTAKISDGTDNGDGTVSIVATQGTNGAFALPAAGTYGINSPSAFTVDTTVGGNPVSESCTIDPTDTTVSYSNITVTKNASTTAASSNSPVKHGAKAVLKAKVTAPNHKPTGKVTFKDGKKSIGTAKLKKGVATLTKSLSKGKHTITMIYKGDGYTTGSKAKTTVTQK